MDATQLIEGEEAKYNSHITFFVRKISKSTDTNSNIEICDGRVDVIIHVPENASAITWEPAPKPANDDWYLGDCMIVKYYHGKDLVIKTYTFDKHVQIKPEVEGHKCFFNFQISSIIIRADIS